MRDLPELRCSKCGSVMKYLPDTEWSKWEHFEIDAICPNCLHVTVYETEDEDAQEPDSDS